MASLIDPTKPVTGNPTTQSVRDNFSIAKPEISALQATPPIIPPGTEYRSPNTSVRSWAQIVRDADKDFDLESRRPVVYEFSNGRKFRQKPDPYATSPGDATSPGYPGGAKA